MKRCQSRKDYIVDDSARMLLHNSLSANPLYFHWNGRTLDDVDTPTPTAHPVLSTDSLPPLVDARLATTATSSVVASAAPLPSFDGRGKEVFCRSQSPVNTENTYVNDAATIRYDHDAFGGDNDSNTKYKNTAETDDCNDITFQHQQRCSATLTREQTSPSSEKSRNNVCGGGGIFAGCWNWRIGRILGTVPTSAIHVVSKQCTDEDDIDHESDESGSGHYDAFSRNSPFFAVRSGNHGYKVRSQLNTATGEWTSPPTQPASQSSIEARKTKCSPRTVRLQAEQQTRDQQHKYIIDMASRYESSEDYLSALRCYEQCLSLEQQQLSKYANNKSVYDSNAEIVSSTDATVRVAEVLHKIGVIRWKTGAYDESLRVLTEASAIFRQSYSSRSGDDNEDTESAVALSEILNSLGRVRLSRGEYAPAMKCYQEGLHLQQHAYGSSETDADDKLEETLEASHQDPNQDPNPEETDNVGKNDTRKKNRKPIIYHPSIARFKICIGMVHDACGQHVKAMKRYHEGLHIQRQTIGNEHVDVAATMNSIGSVYEKCSDYDKAMTYYLEALSIYRGQLGDRHVDVAVTLNNTGQVYYHWSRYDDAMKAYSEALDIMSAVLGESHRNVAATMYNIGLVHAARGRYDRALQIFTVVLQSQRAALGDDHVDVAVTLDSIGEAYEQKEMWTHALKFYSKALRVRKIAYGKKHHYVALTLDRIGKFHMERDGDMNEAIRRFGEALTIYRANGCSEAGCKYRETAKNIVTATRQRMANIVAS